MNAQHNHRSDFSNNAVAKVKRGSQRASHTSQGWLDAISAPQGRADLWNSMKQSPLANSLLLTEFLGSSIPLGVFLVSVALSAGTCFLGAALVFAFLVVLALAVLVPILAVTVPTAAFVWFTIVSSISLVQWAYSQIYVGSEVQNTLHNISDELVQTTREIEHNASNEIRGYKAGVQEQANHAQHAVQDTYNSAAQATKDTYNSAAQVTKDTYNSAAQATDQTLRNVDGAVGTLFKDDGVVQGITAKTERFADKLGNAGRQAPNSTHNSQPMDRQRVEAK